MPIANVSCLFSIDEVLLVSENIRTVCLCFCRFTACCARFVVILSQEGTFWTTHKTWKKQPSGHLGATKNGQHGLGWSLQNVGESTELLCNDVPKQTNCKTSWCILLIYILSSTYHLLSYVSHGGSCHLATWWNSTPFPSGHQRTSLQNPHPPQ